MPGEAGKSTTNRPAWETSAFVEWLDDVLHHLNIAHFCLMGLSQGGWTALKFATAQPERVTKLVLIAPGGVVPDRASFLLRAIPAFLLGKWGTRRLVRDLFGQQHVPDAVIELVMQIQSQFKPRFGTLPLFTDRELAQLTMPTLLLGGTNDILRDMNAIATRLRGHLPHLTVTLVPGAGHALLETSIWTSAYLTDH